jgi:predicted MFS family arabinose efflux permease
VPATLPGEISPHRASGSRARRWWSWIGDRGLSREFWIFFVAALCYEFGVAMFLFLYNLFLLDIGFNDRQLGLITGAMTLGGVVGTIPMGLLAQRAGLRRVLLGGFLFTPAVLVLRAVATGEQAQIALAFLSGLCICFWPVCFSPSVAKLTTEENRTFAFSFLLSIGIGVSGLAGLIGGLLPGWIANASPSMPPAGAKRIVLLLCCAIVVLGTLPASRLKLHVAPEAQKRLWSFDPFLFRFLPAMALWSLAAAAFIPFATAYLSRHAHVSLENIGIIHSAAQLAQILAILMAPAVFRRFGLVTGIMYTQVATAIAIAGLAAAHSLPCIVVFFLSFTAFHWMGGPGIYSLLMNRVAEAKRSNASADTCLVTSVCQAFASAVSGAAYVKFGYPAVLSAVAGLALFAALLFWALMRERSNSLATIPASAEY